MASVRPIAEVYLTDLNEAKAALRSAMLDRRRRLRKWECEEAGTKAAGRLIRQAEIFGSRNIALYWSFSNELPTGALFHELRKLGKIVFLPRVLLGENRLEFCQVDQVSQLKKGYYGIMEPEPYLPSASIQNIELVIIPGVAFDLQGHRLGRGKGIYDKFLKGYQGKRVAIGYDFQVLERIPFGNRDELVNKIVTELREIECRSG